MLVAPKAMHLEPDTFTPVTEMDYTPLEIDTIGLFAWLAEPHAAFNLALQAHADIGAQQMPAKYREILAQTGSWQEADAAWEEAQFEHRNAHTMAHGIPVLDFDHQHAELPKLNLKSQYDSE